MATAKVHSDPGFPVGAGQEDERAPSDDLALQFEAIAQFSEEEKQTVRELLEGLILKHQARRWNTPPRTAAR